MKQLFRTITQTFFSKELYQKAQVESGWKGIKLLCKVLLLVGSGIAVVGLVVLIAFMPRFKGMARSFAERIYPEGLVVTFTDGTMTTNSENPVVIPIPSEWVDTEVRPANDTPTNMLVLAPDAESSIENLEVYDTVALAGSRAVTYGVESEFRTFVYPRDPQTVTKDSFLRMVDTFLRVASIVVYVMVIPMVILMGVTIVIGHLIWLLVVAGVLWLLFKARHEERTYKQVYKMGIYALVPVLLIDIISIPLVISGKVLTAAIVIAVVLVATHRRSTKEAQL